MIMIMIIIIIIIIIKRRLLGDVVPHDGSAGERHGGRVGGEDGAPAAQVQAPTTQKFNFTN